MSKKSIIAVAVLGILAIVLAALPAFIRARNTPSANACINNLRQIDGGTQQWAIEYSKTTNDVPTWEDIDPYVLRDGKRPTCPQGGKYTLGHFHKPPTCSYPGHTLPDDSAPP